MKKLILLFAVISQVNSINAKDPYKGFCTFGNGEGSWYYQSSKEWEKKPKEEKEKLHSISFYSEPSKSSEKIVTVNRTQIHPQDFLSR